MPPLPSVLFSHKIAQMRGFNDLLPTAQVGGTGRIPIRGVKLIWLPCRRVIKKEDEEEEEEEEEEWSRGFAEAAFSKNNKKPTRY